MGEMTPKKKNLPVDARDAARVRVRTIMTIAGERLSARNDH
jgi:hypothetical protein